MQGFLLSSNMDDVEFTRDYAKKTMTVCCMGSSSLQSLNSVLNFWYNNQIHCVLSHKYDPFFLLLQLVSNSGTGRDHSLCVSRPFSNLNHYVDCGSWQHWPMSLGAVLNYLELIAKLPKSLKNPARIMFLLDRWEKWGRHSIIMFTKR